MSSSRRTTKTLAYLSCMHLSAPFKRKPLAASILLASLAGCGVDDDNNNDITLIPTFGVDTPTEVSSLVNSLEVNATFLAQHPFPLFDGSIAAGPELLVNSMEVNLSRSFIDDGGVRDDASGNPATGTPFVFPEPKKGGIDNYFQTPSPISDFEIGENRVTYGVNYNDSQDSISLSERRVVLGSSWMKESAIQYDASGNLFALDQIRGSLLQINNPDEGVKDEKNTLVGIDNPVDFLISGSTAYVLDSLAGIYSVPNFSEDMPGSPDISPLSCVGDEEFVEAVAFDAHFDASGNPVIFYVADRGRQEITTIAADGSCATLSTDVATIPDLLTEDESDTVDQTIFLHLPVDIAYYADLDKLFVTGTSVGREVRQVGVVDSSGNPVNDASGNQLQEPLTTSGFTDALVSIDLATEERRYVAYRSTQSVDASGNPVVDGSGNAVFESGLFIVDRPEWLVFRDDELLVSDQTSGGILALNLTDFDENNAYEARPVSGNILRSIGILSEVLIDHNPDRQIPLIDIASMALRDPETLSVLSMTLGSYISIDLGAPDEPCEARNFSLVQSSEEQNKVLQCEFAGARTLWAGGATVEGTDPDELADEIDDGYEQSARTVISSSRHLQKFQSVSSVGANFLSFDRSNGTPAFNFTPLSFLAGQENLVDELLVSNGAAVLPVTSIDGSQTTYYTIDLDNDRLIAFTDTGSGLASLNTRSEVSASGTGVSFDDPLAAFFWQPALLNEVGPEPDDSVVDLSQSGSYYVLDRVADDFTRVALNPVATATSTETVGSRSPVGVSGCSLATASAMSQFMLINSVDAFPVDLNGNGTANDFFDASGNQLPVDASGNPVDAGDVATSEGAEVFYNDFASLFVAVEKDLLAVDFLTNSCSVLMSDVFSDSPNVVGLSTQLSQQPREDASGNVIGVEQRTIDLMAFDNANMEFVEMQCTQDIDASGNALPYVCLLVDLPYAVATNIPPSPVAMNFDWNSRTATLFDSEVNSIYTVNLVPRNGNPAKLLENGVSLSVGAPVAAGDDDAEVSGQAFIIDRGLPLNCDAQSDPEGCKNL